MSTYTETLFKMILLFDQIKKEGVKDIFYIDLFCGAGGTCTGVELATIDGRHIAKAVACVNHDKNAIASHMANHPYALHFTEDMRTLNLEPIMWLVKKIRLMYPNSKIALWASLECTNFSKAKGGQPRDADSRTLAEHLFRYIEATNPDYIQIENVEEFMCWGDLDENGKPVSKDRGRLYLRWVKNIERCGYEYGYRILNAADFGAYTSRKRYFGQFAKKGLPIAWPTPTHAKVPEHTLFGSLQKWKAVKEVLDFSNEGTSIFGRKKDLSEKTLERIYAGLIKFVAGGKAAFLSRYNSGQPEHKNKSLDEPCGVLTTNNRFAKVQCHFLSKYFSGHPESKNISIDGPAHTIKCKDNHALVDCRFLSAYYGTGDNVSSVQSPSPTVTTKDRFNLVTPDFMMNYYSGGGHLSDLNNPSPAILSTPKQRVISCKFIDQQFGNSKPAGTGQPLGALTANPKYNLISCRPWVMNTNFNNVGSSIEEPSQVITANRKHHYLMNPQFSSAGGNVEDPCFTLIARMDKMPPYLVCTEFGEIAIEIYETDSPMTRKIKEFMAAYGIIDILMRMLLIPELKRIMGFPENYKLIGTKAEQKKYIGNAVEVNMARVLCEALSKKLNRKTKLKTA